MKFLRRMTHIVSILLLFLAGAESFAAQTSKPPTPAPAKSGDKQKPSTSDVKKETQGNQSDPTPSPSVQVNQSPTTTPQFVIQQTNGEKDQGSAANWWIALFTAGLLISAIVQAYVFAKQTGIMSSQLVAATTTAEAAEKSADVAEEALRVVQRAYLLVTAVRLDPFKPDSFPNIHLRLANHGRLPATMIEWATDLVVDEPLPVQRPLNNTLKWDAAMSRRLLKFSGGSVDDYATFSTSTASPSC